MQTFEFSIIASGLDPTADDFESRFYEAGCDDALVAYQRGRIVLDFAREARSDEEAIASAVADVRRAGAHVDRIEPDPLVSLSEIAERSNLTRAAITNYAKGQRGSGFPAPVACVTTRSPLWEWSEIAGWMVEKGRLDPAVLARAVAVRNMNETLATERASEDRDSLKKQLPVRMS